MGYEVVRHTADVRFRLDGRSREDLFASGVEAIMDFLKKPGSGEIGEIPRQVNVKSGEVTTLLVDFLSELLTLAQTYGEVYRRVRFGKLTERELEAEVIGVKVDRFDDDIKAVTYHEAEVKQNEVGVWQTKVVIDV